MAFGAKVILATENPVGKVLWTIEATYPRFIHSEVLTHRDRARNSGSSRAIPWPTMCERIINDPVIPISWGSAGKGMKTGEAVTPAKRDQATKIWLEARDNAVKSAQQLADLGIHKSLCNRITEPWMWITVVMSATEWKNFFRLRAHPDAEIHFQHLTMLIKEAMSDYKPNKMGVGKWHLPYASGYDDAMDVREYLKFTNDDVKVYETLAKISTARCARVSYVQHGEKRKSVEKDLQLWDTLFHGSGFGHWSPMEHPAIVSTNQRSGPYNGFIQFRKIFKELENIEG